MSDLIDRARDAIDGLALRRSELEDDEQRLAVALGVDLDAPDAAGLVEIEDPAPLWLQVARSFLGVREGSDGHKALIAWPIDRLGLDDSAAGQVADLWCAAALSSWLTFGGCEPCAFVKARDFLGYGDPVPSYGVAQDGDIAVLWRGDADDGSTGHAGLLDGGGLLGGNQDDSVSLKDLDPSRILGIRRPQSEQMNARALRLVTDSDSESVGDVLGAFYAALGRMLKAAEVCDEEVQRALVDPSDEHDAILDTVTAAGDLLDGLTRDVRARSGSDGL